MRAGLAQQPGHGVGVGDVDPLELEARPADQARDPRLLQARVVIGVEVVDADHLLAAVEQALGDEPPDESRRSGDDDHARTSLIRSAARCLAQPASRGEGRVMLYGARRPSGPPLFVPLDPWPTASTSPSDPPAPTRVEVVTFGCRLNAYESEQIKARAAARRPRGRGGVQHLRGHRRGGAPGPPGDPQGPARAARRAHRSSPAAPPRSTPHAFAGMAEVDLVLGNAEKLAPGAYAPTAPDEGVLRVNDIFARARDRRPPGRRPDRPRAGLCRGAERLRPPLHLLRHPLRPRKLPLGRRGRGGRAGRAGWPRRAGARWC